MTIISQEIWDNLPEDFKQSIIAEYNERILNYMKYQMDEDKVIADHYEYMYGKENLQPKPKIKTWEDVKDNSDSSLQTLLNLNCACDGNMDNKLSMKIKATYKIAKLIEVGYGGMVTYEEWMDENTEKWSVLSSHSFGDFDIVKLTIGEGWKSFISFHTKEQADEFMSYPENVKLVEQYNMI